MLIFSPWFTQRHFLVGVPPAGGVVGAGLGVIEVTRESCTPAATGVTPSAVAITASETSSSCGVK